MISFSDISKAIKTLSQLGKITENLSKLPEIQQLVTENEKLKKQLDKEKEKIELRKAFKHDNRSFCILDKNINGHEPGKYCNLCFETKDQVILLREAKESMMGPNLYCHNCEKVYYI